MSIMTGGTLDAGRHVLWGEKCFRQESILLEPFQIPVTVGESLTAYESHACHMSH